MLARLTFLLLIAIAGSSCGLFGPSDETIAAGKVVQEANADLRKIKELYEENEGDVDKPGKREQLKKALEANDEAQVKKIADEVNFLIVDGMSYAKSAIEKIQQAQEMNINADYASFFGS